MIRWKKASSASLNKTSTVVENLCMRPNIGPAAAGPAGPVATALQDILLVISELIM